MVTAFKVGVVGSRGFNDYALIESTLDAINISLIISGGANGADCMAEKYADSHGIDTLIFKPDWSLGNHAGMLRNQKIIDAADMIIAFWDGVSKGTKDSIARAKKKGILCKIVMSAPSNINRLFTDE